ncbi:hypothetical protein [Xenorhabdus sp. BG5]|uniref:hypothetical protein n=1 Tax=Xenorhabdus sp. BG5 TaxID=2782014 RepID=UPI0018824947|nr:hypothetical protein [Xenorhabdus sp. BG5]MBE8595291.1 hypothetical protein [Xenorhabdus sp. BG5]
MRTGAVWVIGEKREKNKKVFSRNIKGSFEGADKTVGGDAHREQKAQTHYIDLILKGTLLWHQSLILTTHLCWRKIT